MKKIGSVWDGVETLEIFADKYLDGGRMAVLIVCESGEPYGDLSINAPDEVFGIEPKEFILNHNVSTAIQVRLLASCIFEDTGKRVHYGMVRNQPVWRLVG